MQAQELGNIEEHLLSLPDWPWFLADDLEPKLVMVSDKERLKDFKKSLRELDIQSREEFEEKLRSGENCIDVSASVICKEGHAANAETMRFIAKSPIYVERLILALRQAWKDIDALKASLQSSTAAAQEALTSLQRAKVTNDRARSVLTSFRALLLEKENDKS